MQKEKYEKRQFFGREIEFRRDQKLKSQFFFVNVLMICQLIRCQRYQLE